MIERCVQIIEEGGQLDFEQAMVLAEQADLDALCRAADKLCRNRHGNAFDLCSIINARSGRCSEDCCYCAQSSRYNVDISCYEQIDKETALAQARGNDSYGVRRLSLVTAGRSQTHEQLEAMGELYRSMADETNLLFCASMGFLTPDSARQLYTFGVRRYHCNLETCREFFLPSAPPTAGRRRWRH